MDLMTNLIKNNNYSLMIFDCRYGSVLTGVIAHPDTASWIEGEMNGDDFDYDQMNTFLTHYQKYLFYETGLSVPELIEKLNNKIKNTSQKVFDEQRSIYHWGYSLYEKGKEGIWLLDNTKYYKVNLK